MLSQLTDCPPHPSYLTVLIWQEVKSLHCILMFACCCCYCCCWQNPPPPFLLCFPQLHTPWSVFISAFTCSLRGVYDAIMYSMFLCHESPWGQNKTAKSKQTAISILETYLSLLSICDGYFFPFMHETEMSSVFIHLQTNCMANALIS